MKLDIPKKQIKKGGLSAYFSEKTLEISKFVNLPLEILDKTSLQPWKLCKII